MNSPGSAVSRPQLSGRWRPWPALWLLLCIIPAQADELRDGIEAYDRGNYTEAFEILDNLALDGNPRALSIAGFMWETGLGTRADGGEARRYYQAGVDREDVKSMLGLGRLYATGNGVEKNSAEAVNWYRKAVQHGDNEARFALANMLLQGQGVEKDPDQAVNLLLEAAGNGHSPSQQKLAKIFRDGQRGAGTTPSISF